MKLVITALVLACLGFSSSSSVAQIPCEVIAVRNCFDAPGNPFSYCSATECSNDACPTGTTEAGPTEGYYNEIMEEQDAINEGLDYEGPYETFSSPGTEFCRATVTCNGCNMVAGVDYCKSPVEFGEDWTDPAYTFSMSEVLISGVDWCQQQGGGEQ